MREHVASHQDEKSACSFGKLGVPRPVTLIEPEVSDASYQSANNVTLTGSHPRVAVNPREGGERTKGD